MGSRVTAAVMKTLVILSVLLPCVTWGSAMESKTGKFLFNIIQFTKDPCQAADGKTGVCMTATECTTSKGAASGTCARGYGTCCLLVKNTCGDTVKANNTYIRNPKYPAVDTKLLKTCKYEIENPGKICQYRIDFDSLRLKSPDATSATQTVTGPGICTADSLTITDPNKQKLPVICGKNTGQHMYVNAGKKGDKVTVDFVNSADVTWDLRVTMLECGSPVLAPPGCLQYQMGEMGKVSTFNFDGSKQLLQDQNYAICVRPEAGTCGIEWMENPDTTDAFIMSTSTWTAADVTDAGKATKAGPGVGSDCTESWITIPGGFTAASKSDVIDTYKSALFSEVTPEFDIKLVGPQDRMCGLHLNNKGMTDKTADGGISPAGNAAVVPTAVDFDSTNIKDTVKSYTSYSLIVHSRTAGDTPTKNAVKPTGFKLMYKLLNKCA